MRGLHSQALFLWAACKRSEHANSLGEAENSRHAVANSRAVGTKSRAAGTCWHDACIYPTKTTNFWLEVSDG
ncbi:MAG: hypothetical protein CMF12_03955 [Idiomarina sp.]|nr:hypothetical protein [Idiomarina sp.]